MKQCASAWPAPTSERQPPSDPCAPRDESELLAERPGGGGHRSYNGALAARCAAAMAGARIIGVDDNGGMIRAGPEGTGRTATPRVSASELVMFTGSELWAPARTPPSVRLDRAPSPGSHTGLAAASPAAR